MQSIGVVYLLGVYKQTKDSNKKKSIQVMNKKRSSSEGTLNILKI